MAVFVLAGEFDIVPVEMFTDREAYGFLGLYGFFLVWMTLESIGIIETVQGI